MTPALKFSGRYWLSGIALAALGVSINRLFAPLFDARPRAGFALAGELIALAGLGVIMIGINRRLRAASAASPSGSSSSVEAATTDTRSTAHTA